MRSLFVVGCWLSVVRYLPELININLSVPPNNQQSYHGKSPFSFTPFSICQYRFYLISAILCVFPSSGKSGQKLAAPLSSVSPLRSNERFDITLISHWV